MLRLIYNKRKDTQCFRSFVASFSFSIWFYLRLETLKEEEWGGDVTVVSCDMREWDAPEQVRI